MSAWLSLCIATACAPEAIGDGYLLVKITDELDIEYVALYPLLAAEGQR